MFSKTVNKSYAVFIIAWLVIFIFCSILSGVSSAAESDNEKENTEQTTPAAGTSEPTVSETDVSDPPDPPVTLPETAEDPIGIALPTDPNNAQYVIYLDAGHGWADNGCSILNRTDIYEKDVTLAVTKRIQTSLETMGYTVRMTRENDEECVEELIDGIYRSTRRVQYANQKGADYYVSIHVDNFDDQSVKGTRIYYVDRFPESGALSEQIATSLSEQLHISKPLLKDDRNYNVLVVSTMPSILIEIGFASNPEDAANMVDEIWQERFARSVALGIDAQVKADAQG